MKPFTFFPHEMGQQGQPAERELKSFFDEPVTAGRALQATPAPAEDLNEGLDLPVEVPEDDMIDELVKNHPNNVAKRKQAY